MAQFSRHTMVDWNGTLMEGKGVAKAGTGAFNLPVTFPQRIGEAGGATSPEELIAAAHAACYAMVVAGAMAKNNVTAKAHHVTSTVTADKTDAGITITTSRLDVVVEGPQGMDAAKLEQTLKDAEKNCPVSRALRGGTMNIEVNVSVK
jgi:osmotically inducible protein OsmC